MKFRWPWKKLKSESPPVDEHTYLFGAPESKSPEPQSSTPYHEFFVRFEWLPGPYGERTRSNIGYDTLAEAREAALSGLRKFALGDRNYRPIAIGRVRWKGALRRAIEEQQQKA